jgi:hypothetical protein
MCLHILIKKKLNLQPIMGILAFVFKVIVSILINEQLSRQLWIVKNLLSTIVKLL